MAGAAGGAAVNPFSMPEADLFWLTGPGTETEQECNQDLRVWEKSTAASRNFATKMLRDEELPMAALPPAQKQELESSKGRALEKARPEANFLDRLATKPAIGLADPLRSDERNIRTYVDKKREMFLLHMSLDVKKEETIRLDEQARMWEEALMKSQAMLEADRKKFEEYLQGRIALAQSSMKDAEGHTKRKQEKLARIKNLRTQIATVQSEISKHKEVREDCSGYQSFLDKLTPSEWKEEQKEIKLGRKAQRCEGWIRERMAVVEDKLAEEERQLVRSLNEEEAASESKRKPRGQQKRKEEEEAAAERERQLQARRRRMQKKREDNEKRIASEYEEVSSEEEYELYFKEPKQLMSIFTELEGKNLFLIQSLQETEQLWDDLQQQFTHTKQDMGLKVQQLKEQMRQLEQNISAEKRRGEELRKKYDEKADTSAQDQKLADLSQKVQDVYLRCGLSTDHDPDTLQMLATIESKLEEMITGLDEVYHQDADLVMRLEKEKDKERRERLRLEMFKKQAEKQEERLKNSLLRSQAPVHKKTGKQVMFRSPPLRQERRVVKDTSEDEANARDHRVFELYIDRRGKPMTEPPEIEESKRTPATKGAPGSHHH